MMKRSFCIAFIVASVLVVRRDEPTVFIAFTMMAQIRSVKAAPGGLFYFIASTLHGKVDKSQPHFLFSGMALRT
ncbi:hypothetical protein ACYSTK_01095 [Enterobacter ludwigii]